MLILKPTCSVCQRAEEKERNRTKMTEIQPCMVSFKRKERKKEEQDRCFLSVLLFNYRNNGRFPFQLIILLVSRPHCTRTGRHNLIVGIVLNYTWYSGLCCWKKYPEAHHNLNMLFLTPLNNAGNVDEVI